MKFEISASTEADLYPSRLLIGLPSKNLPKVMIHLDDKTILPFKSSQKVREHYEWINQQKVKGLETATLRVSPIVSENEYYKTIIIELRFENEELNLASATIEQSNFLKDRMINWDIAKAWNPKKSNNRTKKITTSNGRWINFKTQEDGLYCIPYSSLAVILDDISSIDPRSISIFMHSNLGRFKKQGFDQSIEENLIEIRIKIEGENDGSFDLNDKITFYGRGSSGFDLKNMDYNWNQNLYYTSNSCWLFIPDNIYERGIRVNSIAQPSDGILIDYGLVNYHIEPDIINLESSGTEWLWNPITSGNAHTVLLNLDNPKNGVNFSIKSRFRGYSLNQGMFPQHNLTLLLNSLNGQQIGQNIQWSGSGSRTISEASVEYNLNNGSNIFYIKNSSSDLSSSPYIDYFELEYGRILDFSGSYHFIPPIFEENTKLLFDGIKPENTKLWDISNPLKTSLVNINSENFCYTNASDSLKLYFLSNEED